jgi:excinuclease Cho
MGAGRSVRQQSPTIFEYPDHLRDTVATLPAAAGVYLFHGAPAPDGHTGMRDGLPLYIGKSVNLRGRVLAHLRNPDEARLLLQTQRISHIRTAGEIGALLLEAQLIKQRQPLHNRKLRRTHQLCAIRLHEDSRPEIVHSGEVNFAATPDLHGLFSGRRAAQAWLHELADRERLCLGRLGLERLAAGRACFRAALRRCAGACCGTESPQAHDDRLRRALAPLRLACWPYPGPIGLIERDDTLTQVHVVRNWCYLGSAADPVEAARFSRNAASFDGDVYRILVKPLLTGQIERIDLPTTLIDSN